METNEEKILIGLRELYKQNQTIISTLNSISRAKFSLVDGMLRAKNLQQKEIDALAKEFGGEIVN